MGFQPVGSSKEGSEDTKLDKNPQTLFLHPCHGLRLHLFSFTSHDFENCGLQRPHFTDRETDQMLSRTRVG